MLLSPPPWYSVASVLLMCLLMDVGSALTFRDCWFLFGGVNDIGYSHANNLARLDIHRQLRTKYPNHTIESVAFPGTFFLTDEDREQLINQSLMECDLIIATSDGLLNNRHLEYAANFPNVSLVLATGTPIT